MSLSTYSATPGAAGTITGVVHNRGTIGSSAGQLRFATFDAEGEVDWLGAHFFQRITAGSSVTFETTFDAPSVAGDYRYYTLPRIVARGVELCSGESDGRLAFSRSSVTSASSTLEDRTAKRLAGTEAFTSFTDTRLEAGDD